MKNVNTIILSLAATSMTALLAGAHAQETTPSDWPEPVVDYYTGTILFDRFEYTRTDEDENIGVWDMVGWYGGDTYLSLIHI